MIWGISKAIEEHGSVPQVIWDRGGWGKEPMVRLLGKDASQVVFLTLKILQDSKL
jgi:hydroxymethylpyrimidine/phosphomethylpyrimidine kinase